MFKKNVIEKLHANKYTKCCYNKIENKIKLIQFKYTCRK